MGGQVFGGGDARFQGGSRQGRGGSSASFTQLGRPGGFGGGGFGSSDRNY